MTSPRSWICPFCKLAVVGPALQQHLIEHERDTARDRGDHFVWFDETHGACAYCGGGVSRARAHLHIGNCSGRPA